MGAAWHGVGAAWHGMAWHGMVNKPPNPSHDHPAIPPLPPQGLLPPKARMLLGGGSWREVPSESVAAGDLLTVLPGDRVPGEPGTGWVQGVAWLAVQTHACPCIHVAGWCSSRQCAGHVRAAVQ